MPISSIQRARAGRPVHPAVPRTGAERRTQPAGAGPGGLIVTPGRAPTREARACHSERPAQKRPAVTWTRPSPAEKESAPAQAGSGDYAIVSECFVSKRDLSE